MNTKARQIQSLLKGGLDQDEAEQLVEIGIPTIGKVNAATDEKLEKVLSKAKVKALRDMAEARRKPKKPK